MFLVLQTNFELQLKNFQLSGGRFRMDEFHSILWCSIDGKKNLKVSILKKAFTLAASGQVRVGLVNID